MAKITYVDQKPNSNGTGSIGISGTEYGEMWVSCVNASLCINSPVFANSGSDILISGGDLCVCDGAGGGFCDICGQNIVGNSVVQANSNLYSPTWCNAGAMTVDGGALIVCTGGATWCDICGGNIYSNGSQLTGSPWTDMTGYYCLPSTCSACIGGDYYGTMFSDSCVCVSSGFVSTDYLCYGSQGCICVSACLIDCNGAEILGGATGLWTDGTGYICSNNNCNICACSAGTGGCIIAACDVCAGGSLGGSNLYVGGGAMCGDLLCYGSQGCICVCSCLIDCNGAEILGGGSSLWYDGTGYICPNNNCPVCASNLHSSGCIDGYCYYAQGNAGVSYFSGTPSNITVCYGIVVSIS